MTRLGVGFDAHKLEDGLPLMLGGVHVPSPKGLAGHSDGDVVLHSIIDSLLGSAALGDMGTYFQSDDPEVPPGISSLLLLERTRDILDCAHWEVMNIDCTLVAEQPRISPWTFQMRKNIADALGLDIGKVSIKSTTSDGLGFTGNGLGMAAYAVCGVQEMSK